MSFVDDDLDGESDNSREPFTCIPGSFPTNPQRFRKSLETVMIRDPSPYVIVCMETMTLNLIPDKLVANSQAGAVSKSAQSDFRQPRSLPVANDRDQIVTLRPRPLLWLRKTLACSWCGYLIITPWSPSFKLNCCLIGLVILGTFRQTNVSATKINWHYRFAFMPFYRKTMLLQNHSCILTGWEEGSGLGEALLLGLWGTCFAPLSDWLCPWPGGSYRLWVKNTQGQRVLVWRGRVARHFHRNHKLLSQATGLPSQRIQTA